MASPLHETTVVYALRLRKPGVTRKVTHDEARVTCDRVTGQDAQDPDDDAVRIAKILLEGPEFERVVSLDGEIRRYLRSESLPTELGPGRYLIPLVNVERVDARLADYRAERARRVDAFVDAYPGLVENARARLRDLFDATDYPRADEIRGAFGFRSKISALEVPGTGLQRISEALFRREEAKARRSAEAMADEIRQGVRYAMSELVGALERALAPRAQGEKRRLLAPAVERLGAFLDAFDSRNTVGQDGALGRLVAQARELVAGADPETLRASVEARDSVRSGLRSIGAEIEALTSADASAVRASFVVAEAWESEPSAPETPTELGERAARLDDAGAPAAEPTSLESGVRVVDLEDPAPASAPPTNPEPTSKPRPLELDDAPLGGLGTDWNEAGLDGQAPTDRLEGRAA